ncbi:MAG: hypothetical protein VW270_21440 [Candidatus Poseidoniales archaeon]
MICDLCGETYEGYGNNGNPLIDGRVCSKCNEHVILMRMMLLSDVINYSTNARENSSGEEE